MSRKNKKCKNQNGISDSRVNLLSGSVLNRIRLVRGDLERWLTTIKEPEIAKALRSENLKEETKFVLESMTENFDKYSKNLFYDKMFNIRIPIYDRTINMEKIIVDSSELITEICKKWSSAKLEEKTTLLAQLRDNFIKIKLIVLALKGFFDKIDTYLEYYFKLQANVFAVSDFVQEIFDEYCEENQFIVI